MVGPAQEHVGDDGNGRRRVGPEPREQRFMEPSQGAHHCSETGGRQVLAVLYAKRNRGVRRKRKDKGFDGRACGEKRAEEVEVLWGDKDSDGEAVDGQEMGKVQKGNHVALCRVRKYQDVSSGGGRDSHG